MARAFPFLAALLLLGCSGPSGPPRYDVEGEVTFQGKPIPAGRVVFEPDNAKGNRGPASYAEIENGHYATPRGEGTVGGPHLVRISGYDGVAQGEMAYGRELFAEYETHVDLPQEATQRDFDVPASAAKR